MRIIILSTFLLIGLTSIAQNKSHRSNDYYLEGRIKNESNTLIQACGSHAWALVVEFEIIEFSDKSYNHNFIPVIFTCPLSYKKNFFKKGKKYKLKLADQKQTDFYWIISNSEAFENYDIKYELWVTEVINKKRRI